MAGEPNDPYRRSRSGPAPQPTPPGDTISGSRSAPGRNKNGGNSVDPWSGPLPNGAPGAQPGFDATQSTLPQPPAMPPLPPGFDPNAGGPTPPPVGHNGGHYNPTTAPFGFDMSGLGTREQFWENNQDLWFQNPQLDWINSLLPQFAQPMQGEQWNKDNFGGMFQQGAGQQYWNGIAGQGNTKTGAQQMVSQGYRAPNHAQAAFNQTQSRMPGSMEPQFDAYYDRMKQKAMSDVNTQGAARGVYGSNASLNNTIGASIDVEAQRAKAATDFEFQDSQNQMNWLNSLAQQGRGADLSNLGAFGANVSAGGQDLERMRVMGDLAFRSEEMGFNKEKALSDLAFGIDDQAMDRLGAGIETGIALDRGYDSDRDAGFNAAGAVQSAREQRVNNLYDDNESFSRDIMSFFSENYDALLGGDQQLSEAELNTLIAQAADERGWDQQTQERMRAEVQMAIDGITGKKSAAEAGKK